MHRIRKQKNHLTTIANANRKIPATPHLVGCTPTVQNSLPALHTHKTASQVHFTEHLISTTKHSSSRRSTASRQAAEFTVGLGDLQRLPGLFQGASGDLPPHQNQEGKKLITRKPRRVRRRREGMLTMMRSTPAAHARASTAGMSAAWHCLPW